MPKAKKSVQPIVKKQLPVSWMDGDVATMAKDLDALERIVKADELEAKAAQLRGFKQKKLATNTMVTFWLVPACEHASLAFHEKFGGNAKEEVTRAQQLNDASRWMLEFALMMMPLITKKALAFTKYREAELVENNHLMTQ
jgi:hypothetical protein